MRTHPRRLTALLTTVGLLVALAPAPAAAATGAGWLDPTFGNGGFTSVPRAVGSQTRCGTTVGVTFAGTGRIFVGAAYCQPTSSPSEVAAFTASGRVDRAFNGGRPVTVDFGGGSQTSQLLDLFATNQGGLVAYVGNGPSACDRMLAYGPAGSRISSYGQSCMPDPPDEQYVFGLVTRLPGGSIRECSRAFDESAGSSEIALSGLTPAGDVDTRIGAAGYRELDFATCIAFTSDSAGRLYWVSRRWLPDGRAVIDVHRTTHTGDLTSDWGTGGLASIELPGGHLKPVTAVAGADGSLLIGVGISSGPHNDGWRAGVVRFTPVGLPDAAFGTSGVRVYLPPETNGSRLEALTVDSTGRPIVSVSVPTGRPYPGPYSIGFLVRGSAASGAPDPAFGQGGWVTINRPAVDLAMAGPSRILLVSKVFDGLILSARRN